MTTSTSGLRRVSFYRDSAGCTCDRCGTFIKNVALVAFVDGTSQRFGSECINKILAGNNSLVAVWKRNAKLLQSLQAKLEILSLPEDQIPVDPAGYYDRGYFFIADADGKTMWGLEKSGHALFHPTKIDFSKANFDGSNTFDMRGCGKGWYSPNTPENWAELRRHEIAQCRAWLQGEINRISAFLARVLAQGLAVK